MPVLVAFDKEHRAYGEFIAAAIGRARPEHEAKAVLREALEEELHHSDPYLVICSPPLPENPVSSREAWMELSVDPQQPSRIRLGEQRWETLNPSLEELVSVVDLLWVAKEAHKRASSHNEEESPKGWERFMEAERNALLDRVYGRLARALGQALEGEDQEEIDRMADEDRSLAEEGLVLLMSKDGEISHKHLDELTPQDAPARISAERAMVDWLLARTEEKRSWKRYTITSEPSGA